MSKEGFLDTAIGLLQIYVENDHDDQISEILKEELDVDERDIPSVLYTIRNWRFKNETD